MKLVFRLLMSGLMVFTLAACDFGGGGGDDDDGAAVEENDDD